MEGKSAIAIIAALLERAAVALTEIMQYKHGLSLSGNKNIGKTLLWLDIGHSVQVLCWSVLGVVFATLV